MDKDDQIQWLSVLAKSLAAIAMHQAKPAGTAIIERAEFLEGLGIPRADVAKMLNSTSESLRVMFSTRDRKSDGKPGKKKDGGGRRAKKS